ncbi:hypothetical protein ASG52_00140 [Methylobacterium sp. Leaf456]|uniref:hypothetical protein n=1 Tax=Methylobacterium sp. Leaf456 TaxID=1736382 RepID=UPI0006FA5C0C|nr:hypothetical protein [Methylobacterium sp. Leaf456]KQT61338.1 hypothetical protein ASG52_00140 [Methylobacterium sp. Leaf456]
MFFAVSALIALAAAVLCLRQGRRSAAWRAGLFSDCAALLEASRLGRDRAGFATLDGSRDGMPVTVRLIPEALVHRRLPQLWLSVSLRCPLPTEATLDVLRRPAGAEFYAPADLPLRLDTPAGWPADTLVRGTSGAVALLRQVEPIFERILADPRVKEVLVTPRGLRLVVQAAEGARGAYLLLRGSRFDLDHVAPALLDGTLAGLHRLARALSQNEEVSHARAA